MPALEIRIDFETRSTVDLKKTGVHAYAEDLTTDVWCAAYAIAGEEPKLWIPGNPVPPEVHDAETFVAHNAAFEIAIWREIMVKQYGWPRALPARWRCTMAQSYAMAMPGSLEDAAAAFGVDQQKDAAGRRLMLSMAKPRKVVGNLPVRAKLTRVREDGTQLFRDALGNEVRVTWWNEQDRKLKLYDYCLQDVRAEMALDRRTLRLRPQEQRLWVLDQKINDRGVYVDHRLCEAAQELVEISRQDLNRKIKEVSGYRVASTTAVSQIIAFLGEHGVRDIPGLASDQVAELLARDDLPPACRAVLELRQQGARMATAKIGALVAGSSKDGRARGLLQYHAAGTGRWGGRRFQPQNLLRPTGPTADLIDPAIALLRDRRFDTFNIIFDDPIGMIGNCIRGMVAAPPGRKIGSLDFANIEGRVLAWLAGETWKVQAFREYDAGTGPDLYKLAFSMSFGVPVGDVAKDQRQVGKVQELALGYQGGPVAFQTMARGYGVDIGARYDEITAAAPGLLTEATEAWETYGRKSGMAKRNWLAAEIVKRGWREAHPRVVEFWSDIERAAITAVERPGTVIAVGRLRFRMAGSFLWMQLPSGRTLCYPYPEIRTKETPWGAEKETLHFFGQDTYTRKWGRTHTYGGKLTENAVQAIARDLLAEALTAFDDNGIETVLHVHDEIVFECAEDTEIDELAALMAETPGWAEGLPVAADGWIGDRYRKG